MRFTELYESLLDPNYKMGMSKEFQKWFGKSVVKDMFEEEPQVVYHGTNSKFKVFDERYASSRSSAIVEGFYFTPDISTAKIWGKIIMPVYLRIEKPMYVNGRITHADEVAAKKGGYDGIIQVGGEELVVFKSNQIKSIHNKGTYNNNSNDIYK